MKNFKSVDFQKKKNPLRHTTRERVLRDDSKVADKVEHKHNGKPPAKDTARKAF